MEHIEELSLGTRDTHGFVPDPYLIGNIVSHTGNDNQYIITGFVWMGATDEWGYKHQVIGTGQFGVEIVRPLSHLCGERSSGEYRYQEWYDYTRYTIIPPDPAFAAVSE